MPALKDTSAANPQSRCRSNNNSHDCRNKVAGEEAADHGAEPDLSQISPTLGKESADPADLYRDAREVRKAAERITREGNRPRIEGAGMILRKEIEIDITDEFVENDSF